MLQSAVKLLISVSIGINWLMCICFFLALFIFPIVGPIHARMSHTDLPTIKIVFISTFCAALSYLFWSAVKRRVFSFLLIFSLTVLLMIKVVSLSLFIWLVFPLWIIYGLPLVIAYRHELKSYSKTCCSINLNTQLRYVLFGIGCTRNKRDLMRTLKESNSVESKVLVEAIQSLSRNEFIEDSSVKDAAFCYFDKMQSNCDSVAQGQISILSTICFFRPHLASELFEKPLQSLYYLGAERIEDINKYLVWFSNFDEPYLGRGPDESYDWLRIFIESGDEVIKVAFKKMYEKEDNDWRHDVPEILKS